MRLEIIANEEIRANKVRLIDADGKMNEVSLHDAMEIANHSETDLIQVTVDHGVPVCKLGDLSKYKYQMQQKAKQQNRSAKRVKRKEIQITPFIADHDLEIKLASARRILEGGDCLLLKLTMKGREVLKANEYAKKLNEFADQLSCLYKKRSGTVISGRYITISLQP